MSNKFEIILIGSGQYVCGGNKNGFGTILPAILTFAQIKKVELKIFVAINSQKSATHFTEKISKLKQLLNIEDLIKHKIIYCNGSPNIFLNQYKSKSEYKAAFISIPDHLHFIWAEKLIKAKLPLMIVKPLTLKLEESRILKKLSEDYSTPLYSEFHKRYDRQIKFTKDSFEKGLIGKILYAHTEYTQKKEVPLENFSSWAEMTNIFSYLGVHYIDIVRYITKSVPKRISATGQKLFLRDKGIDTYDSIQCNLEWETKDKQIFNQIIMCSWIESNKASAMSKQDFHLVGTNGRLDCEQKNRGLQILTDSSETEDINPDFTRMYKHLDKNIFEGYGIDSIVNFLENIFFSKSNRIDKRLCDIQESLYSTATIEACTISLKNKSDWIDIENIDQ